MFAFLRTIAAALVNDCEFVIVTLFLGFTILVQFKAIRSAS